MHDSERNVTTGSARRVPLFLAALFALLTLLTVGPELLAFGEFTAVSPDSLPGIRVGVCVWTGLASAVAGLIGFVIGALFDGSASADTGAKWDNVAPSPRACHKGGQITRSPATDDTFKQAGQIGL